MEKGLRLFVVVKTLSKEKVRSLKLVKVRFGKKTKALNTNVLYINSFKKVKRSYVFVQLG